MSKTRVSQQDRQKCFPHVRRRYQLPAGRWQWIIKIVIIMCQFRGGNDKKRLTLISWNQDLIKDTFSIARQQTRWAKHQTAGGSSGAAQCPAVCDLHREGVCVCVRCLWLWLWKRAPRFKACYCVGSWFDRSALATGFSERPPLKDKTASVFLMGSLKYWPKKKCKKKNKTSQRVCKTCF